MPACWRQNSSSSGETGRVSARGYYGGTRHRRPSTSRPSSRRPACAPTKSRGRRLAMDRAASPCWSLSRLQNRNGKNVTVFERTINPLRAKTVSSLPISLARFDCSGGIAVGWGAAGGGFTQPVRLEGFKKVRGVVNGGRWLWYLSGALADPTAGLVLPRSFAVPRTRATHRGLGTSSTDKDQCHGW